MCIYSLTQYFVAACVLVHLLANFGHLEFVPTFKCFVPSIPIPKLKHSHSMMPLPCFYLYKLPVF